jgi:uncharacterized membrane protein
MNRGRVEAFSDGVIAILITIMVLELRAPVGGSLESLKPIAPVFLSYVLSFVFLGIYWSNHHHLFHTVAHVNGRILWANLHLLFWLSLVPFVTGWMGENYLEPVPTAVYGCVLLLAGVAYFILTKVIIAADGPNSTLARAIGRDFKGTVSPLLYGLAMPLAFIRPWIAQAIYLTVALIWLSPDPRIESTLAD